MEVRRWSLQELRLRRRLDWNGLLPASQGCLGEHVVRGELQRLEEEGGGALVESPPASRKAVHHRLAGQRQGVGGDARKRWSSAGGYTGRPGARDLLSHASLYPPPSRRPDLHRVFVAPPPLLPRAAVVLASDGRRLPATSSNPPPPTQIGFRGCSPMPATVSSPSPALLHCLDLDGTGGDGSFFGSEAQVGFVWC